MRRLSAKHSPSAKPNRTGNAGTARATITARVLSEILLVISFGEIEVLVCRYLCGDAAKSLRLKQFPIHNS